MGVGMKRKIAFHLNCLEQGCGAGSIESGQPFCQRGL